MKKFKKILVTLTALALLLTPIFSTPIQAQAEEPVIYYLRYVTELNQWRFQNDSWKDGGYHRELYYLEKDIKDGDHIVVDSNMPLTLNVDVNLGSLTLMNTTGLVFSAKSIENCYCLYNTVSAINGDVANAYVYASATANFNNNVTNLYVAQEKGDILDATVSVVGTVDHVKAYTQNYLHFEFYSFEKGSLVIDNGTLKTEASKYSKTVPVVSSPSDEYDEVPKMGDVTPSPVVVIGIAALVIAGFGLWGYMLEKKEN